MKSSRALISTIMMLISALFLMSGCSDSEKTSTFYSYEVINAYPHDSEAFTQGLVYYDGLLYEGTGLWGESSLRIVDLESGEILKKRYLPQEFFGEGITIFRDRIYQLTWQSRTGFIYDLDNFELIGNFSIPGEGWGITHDGTHLIMSDGTSNLNFLDPLTLKVMRKVQVHDSRGPVYQLNELEYVNGKIYANVWKTDLIAIIQPESGRVAGWIDLEGILGDYEPKNPVDILNGIAYDEENDRLFVTGKLWPWLFQIETIPMEKKN